MLVQSAESDNEITKGPLQKEPVLQWALLAVGTGVKPKELGYKQLSAWSSATVQAEKKGIFPRTGGAGRAVHLPHEPTLLPLQLCVETNIIKSTRNLFGGIRWST